MLLHIFMRTFASALRRSFLYARVLNRAFNPVFCHRFTSPVAASVEVAPVVAAGPAAEA